MDKLAVFSLCLVLKAQDVSSQLFQLPMPCSYASLHDGVLTL